MNRARLGSLLGLLCSSLFLCSLFVAIDPYYAHPRDRYFLWGVCGALFITSLGLWFRKRWAQVAFLLVASLTLLLYLAEISLAPGSCAGTIAGCYNHYIQSNPMLAVAHYFVYLTCSHEPDRCCSQTLIRCHNLSTYVQPALTLLAVVILLKPLASNQRLERP
jgi:hypothetical protein